MQLSISIDDENEWRKFEKLAVRIEEACPNWEIPTLQIGLVENFGFIDCYPPADSNLDAPGGASQFSKTRTFCVFVAGPCWLLVITWTILLSIASLLWIK